MNSRIFLMLLFITLVSVDCYAFKINNEVITKRIGKDLVSVEEFELKYNKKFSYVNVDSYSVFDSNNLISVTLQKINWNDPGDFHKIIFTKGTQIYEFSNFEGWVRLSNTNLQFINKLNSYSQPKSEFCLLIPYSDDSFIFIVFGYSYGSSPGLVTIFNIPSDGEPYLIYNDNKYLFNTEDFNGDNVPDIAISDYDRYKIKGNKKLLSTINKYLLINGWLVHSK